MTKAAAHAQGPATSLSDLLAIRRHHSDVLRNQTGYLGSAVGLKYLEKEGRFASDTGGNPIPVVQLFVEKKRSKPGRGALPAELSLPDGRRCATDVIEGTLMQAGEPQKTPKNPGLDALMQRLSSDRRIGGGMPIINGPMFGTAACVVSREGDSRSYLLTNQHVAGFVNDCIEEGSPVSRVLGRTAFAERFVQGTPKGSFAGATSAAYHFDAALVCLGTGPFLEGVHLLPELGAPLQADLSGLSPLGLRVQGVGASLGLRKGVIMSCAYEWDPDPENPEAYSLCDYLIMGEKDGTGLCRSLPGGGAFAIPGDSGMLVVTCEAKPRPVALLWGGQRQTFWHAKAQEGWGYASSITAVMDVLKLRALAPH